MDIYEYILIIEDVTDLHLVVNTAGKILLFALPEDIAGNELETFCNTRREAFPNAKEILFTRKVHIIG